MSTDQMFKTIIEKLDILQKQVADISYLFEPPDNISVNKNINKEELLSQPVYELDLSTRPYKRLCQLIHDKKGIGGVFYDKEILVRDVIELNLDELNIKGLGIKSINEIKMRLHEYLG